MPKKPSDFSKGSIYKLVCRDPTVHHIYVGSTTNWYSRIKDHKGHCCQPNSKNYNQRKYKYIRENGGWDNWRMIEIEKYPCASRRELEAREQHWIDELQSMLNSDSAFKSEDEKKEKRAKYKADYYKAHISEKSSYDRARYENKRAYIAKQNHWRRSSPIGILARAYFE